MIPSLNGLRAFSIILVILSHLLIVESFPREIKILLKPFANGEIGVRIFFVISGFLITWLLLKEKEKTGKINLRKFYLRRLLRIFPVFYFYVLVVWLTGKILGNEVEPEILFVSAVYLQNFSLAGSHWLLAHSWSLAVEEQFYLIWPWISKKTNKLLPIAVIALVFLIGAFARVVAYKYPSLSNFLLLPFLQHADFLFSGCMLAFMRFNNNKRLDGLIKRISSLVVVVGLFLVFVLGHYEGDPYLDRFFLPISGTYMSIYFMFLIGWTTSDHHNINLIVRLLNLKIVDKIGILSYSLYVWQQFFLVPSYNTYSSYWWTKFPQNLFLLCIAVFISYNLIEKPFLTLKKRFS